MWRKKKLKRIADALEKLGVAGMAIGIFQDKWSALFLGLYFVALSVNLTDED